MSCHVATNVGNTYWEEIWCHWTTRHSFIRWQLSDGARCWTGILKFRKYIYLVPRLTKKYSCTNIMQNLHDQYHLRHNRNSQSPGTESNIEKN